MKILALEFSSSLRTVAVLSSAESGQSAAVLGAECDGGDRKSTPLRLIDNALREARVERNAIDLIAIGLGPGSYTGIRSAIAVAQGWQMGRATKLIGIGSAECLAAQAQEKKWFGTVEIVIDAQRKEIYLARYEITETERSLVLPLRIADPAKTTFASGDDTTVVGPDVARFFSEGRILHPDARALGKLAVVRSGFVSGEALTPIYLREVSFVKAPPTRFPPSE